MPWWRKWTSLWTACLLGCRALPQPDGVVVVAYAPPVEYQGWWEAMLVCSSVVPPVRLTDVHFYRVNGPAFTINGTTVIGLSGKDPLTGEYRIYLTEYVVMDERTVQHEMLHTILDNHPGHPFFPGTWPCRVWTPDGYVIHEEGR